MARTKKPAGPTPVEATTHPDKRANIPTADAYELVDPSLAEMRRVRHERNIPTPELIWRGKDDAYLEADAPPIYIQEKIDPRVLVENLRDTAPAGEAEPELTLFDTFDGLDDLDSIDFYRHEANWSNRMILGDSLMVMSSLAEREQLRGKVQMLYLDPPYGIKFESNWQAKTSSRTVKDGRLEHAAREAEQIKAFRDTWKLGIHSYLSYMRDRLTVGRELLTESGSCFVQIGSANLHLVTSLMAEVFGSENHVETIAFRKKTMPLGGRLLEGAYDYLVWFARDKERIKYRTLFQLQSVQGDNHWNVAVDTENELHHLAREQVDNHTLLPQTWDVSRLMPIYPVGPFDTGIFDFEFNGITYKLPPGKSWPSPRPGMERLGLAGRLRPYEKGQTLQYLLRYSDYPVTVFNNVWTDTSAASGMTYVVETSPKVVQRCMLMCTEPGDLVLDPTCGSGTTAYVAEQWGRRWITVDSSRVALALARQRLMSAKFPYYLLADSEAGRAKENSLSASAMSLSGTTNNIRHGFVYERVPHVTLRSIANNPDIKEGMSRAEIDAAIKRHADSEKLYDKPYEDRNTVRVTGPFTVESLSPHRALSASGEVQVGHESSSESTSSTAGVNFEQTILDNLAKAGIQNGARNERIEFASVEPYAGAYVQAVGERVFSEAARAAPTRVAIALGPQYGTVSSGFIKAAAKEAIADPSIDLLCILGFAYDPQAGELLEEAEVELTGVAGVVGDRLIGRLPVLYVRMNVDLLMGEDLAKTGAGNLFTVFGEPDIAIGEGDDGVIVELRGVDVYDPTKGEVRSADTGQIALWMIDTNYNGESFFVRHCYFTGGGDPYKRLKMALKADIDADAWASLYSTTSRPFNKPETGKIAVKVINDYGDEVMKVFEV